MPSIMVESHVKLSLGACPAKLRVLACGELKQVLMICMKDFPYQQFETTSHFENCLNCLKLLKLFIQKF